MRWFPDFAAFLWHAAILATSLAAECQADKFTVDRAFTEFIRRKRSHFCTSMGEQPNGETKPNHPAYREKVKGQLDRTYQESAAPDFAIPGASDAIELVRITVTTRPAPAPRQPASWRLAECRG